MPPQRLGLAVKRSPSQSDGTTRVIAANGQWHDAELAMKVAQHSTPLITDR
jgi:hypothetical protein